ncbi:MAG: carboxymuconolactone decarboxylase family protein [Hyphomicrobiales bacterium]
MQDEIFERGMEMRRHLVGAERTEQELGHATDMDLPLQDLITRYCFGEVWGRDGLSPKVRSLLTIAMVMALNRQWAVKGHILGALKNGATKTEIRELIIHAMIYCGVPAAVEGMRAAREALREAGLE